jgi:DNA-directed RNA polymerase specialized sigma24 family protein
MSERTDLELAHAVLEGDAAAFLEVYDRRLKPVLAFARRQCATEAEAQALTRSILEAVFAHLDGYSGRAPLGAWVLAVARLVSRATARRPRSSSAAA